jgi:hypothetical protein
MCFWVLWGILKHERVSDFVAIKARVLFRIYCDQSSGAF